jgi:LysM repeat protein
MTKKATSTETIETETLEVQAEEITETPSTEATVAPEVTPEAKTPRTKLTSDQVQEIFVKGAEGQAAFALAKEYGVTPGTILAIFNRTSYKDVEIPQTLFDKVQEFVTARKRFGVNKQREGRSKLNQEQVNEIRAAYPETGLKALGEKYGVSAGTIYDIVKNKTWKVAA